MSYDESPQLTTYVAMASLRGAQKRGWFLPRRGEQGSLRRGGGIWSRPEKFHPMKSQVQRLLEEGKAQQGTSCAGWYMWSLWCLARSASAGKKQHEAGLSESRRMRPGTTYQGGCRQWELPKLLCKRTHYHLVSAKSLSHSFNRTTIEYSACEVSGNHDTSVRLSYYHFAASSDNPNIHEKIHCQNKNREKGL